jgi:glyoxylase-like metal-dependent hydrolase (beta-lactamase superfamily II)
MKTNILAGVLLGAIAASGCAADDNIFTCKIGDFEVSTLVEGRNTGNSSVILGATKEQLDKYAPNGAYSAETNAFVIKTPKSVIVVDTGFGRGLFDNLKKLGIKPEQVDAVLITHLHGDHTGGLARDGKPLFPNAAVYLAAQENAAADKNAAALLACYGAKLRTFSPVGIDAAGAASQAGAQAEILPGIKAIAVFGHTPGHTAYLAESNGQRLLIWGDLVHIEDIQFPYPNIAVRWDTDPAAAIASRERIFAYAAKERIAVAGMHLRYPAIGYVEKAGAGYAFKKIIAER